jgi:8-oxo-dGTP pyrophosphatase MutT (NUDIX family)
MAISRYLRDLRALVGSRLLLLPGVAGIVRDADGRVLFMRRADNGKWGLPAGAIDPGETPAEAIAREVREETGLDVRPSRVAGVFGGKGFRVHYENGDEAEYTVIVFDCEIVGGRLSPADGEALELRYFAPDEAPELQVAYPRSLLHAPRSVADPPRFEPARNEPAR